MNLDLVYLTGWLAAVATVAWAAYTRGYNQGQARARQEESQRVLREATEHQ